MSESDDSVPNMDKIQDVAGLREAASKLRDFILDSNVPWAVSYAIDEDYRPLPSMLCQLIRESVNQLWKTAQGMDFEVDRPDLSDKHIFVLQLNRLIGLATAKVREDEMSEGGPLNVASGIGDDGLFEKLADSIALEMRDIVKSETSVDDKMREMCRLDSRFLGWKSPKWADFFKVSGGAIRKTKFWTDDRPRQIGDD